MRKLRIAFPLALLVLLADCTTKDLAVTTLTLEHTPYEVAGDVVRLTLAYNPAGAMGLRFGDYGQGPFIALGLMIVAVLLRMLWKTPPDARWRRIALGLILGGAAGNLLSRFNTPRGVVDFIDIGIGSWRFYLFNLADVAVCAGAIILAYTLWREAPEDPVPA